MRSIDIPLRRLVLSKLNVRKNLDAGQEDSGVEELAQSITKQGLLSPLIVRAMGDGDYEVISGQRRLLACQRINLDPVPCLVRDDLGDVDAQTVSLVENVHRADMHPLDKAHAIKALFDLHGSYDQVSKQTGWSVQTVKKYVQLLKLPDELQKMLSTSKGPIQVGTLARLASTFSGNDAVDVYDKIAGFTGKIQDEIIKRSDGDAGAVDALVIEAQEGAFDARRCGGRFGCEIVRDILEGEISQADFVQLLRDTAKHLHMAMPRSSVGAARAFWRVLAKH
jgi:ParB family transcriptional regulator, chromosome partitioning protein